jgi:tRNA (guanine-N7-)-methyltransferase
MTKKKYFSLSPLIPWLEAERPLDLAKWFGREAPVEVEIGFGNGEFLVRTARSRPETNFLGIELEWGSVWRALRRIAGARATNVRVLKTDAHIALERLLPPSSVSRAYSLFPCPWSKSRHAKRRLFSHWFLRLLNSRLRDGAQVLVATDDPAYLRWIAGEARGSGLAAEEETTTAGFGTKYERKWCQRGQERFHVLRLRKEEHADVPVKEDVSVETYRVEGFDPERFRPADVGGEVTVRFRDYIYDPRRGRALVRAVVAEERLVQDFWIEISRTGAAWRVALAPGCRTLPTHGVKTALAAVRDAAQSPPFRRPGEARP